MDLKGAVDEQLVKLRAAGISAAVDPQDLNVPGVLLRPPTLATRFAKGYDAEWEAWLIAADTGIYASLAGFGPLVDRVQDALGWPIKSTRNEDVLIGQGAALPALVLTFTSKFTPATTSTQEAAHA